MEGKELAFLPPARTGLGGAQIMGQGTGPLRVLRLLLASGKRLATVLMPSGHRLGPTESGDETRSGAEKSPKPPEGLPDSDTEWAIIIIYLIILSHVKI